MSDGFWKLERHAARFALGGLEARLDPARPDLGLQDLVVLGAPLPGAALLGVELPGSDTAPEADLLAADVYARGADLVASYPPRSDWPFAAQIYWRAWIPERAAALAAVELIVSVQTQLLDSRPGLCAASRLPDSDAFRLTSAERGAFIHSTPARIGAAVNGPTAPPSAASDGACDCVMLRPTDAVWTYGEIVHPTAPAHTQLLAEPSPVAASTGGKTPIPSRVPPRIVVRHSLFAERLEKGVILRARLLAAFVDRERERAELAALYREFAASDPPLTT